jgi:hypothetical protein
MSHPKFIHALIKHKDFINYILLSPILSNHIDLSKLSSQIHILQSTILLPYLSYHDILINLKCWTNPFKLSVLFDFVWIVWCVYVVLFQCYSFVRRATCLVERSESSSTSKRQVPHISSTHFYYCISVFSSMHDRWNIQLFYKMLDPSSE